MEGYSLYQLCEEAYTPFGGTRLFDFAKSQDVILFSTPFDETAVDLHSLEVPAFKIASFEITVCL